MFRPVTDFPEIQEGLVINPGDTVIFTVGQNELDTPEQVEDYYRRIREVMPDGVKVILTSTRPTVIRRDPSLEREEETHGR